MTKSDLPRKFRRRRWVAAASVLVVVLVVLFINRGSLRDFADQISGKDYAGQGDSTISFTIKSGESGNTIAHNLSKYQIVKSFEVTYRKMLVRESKFYPGSYQLRLHMSSTSALDALANPSNLQVTHVTIQEGLRLSQVFTKLSQATEIPISSFVATASNLNDFDIPSKAPSLEGFLFPATYDFPAGANATEILRLMVSRCLEELDKYQVSKDDYLRVITMASIIQKEARQPNDFYKVSRVFANRLAINMPLQSDATVSYGSGGTTVTTTDAERAAKNGYNTYAQTGLPIGPISAPGSIAIDAALHPVSGKWLFFCAINLKTGETVFSETAAEHALAVAKFRAWMAANPGWNG